MLIALLVVAWHAPGALTQAAAPQATRPSSQPRRADLDRLERLFAVLEAAQRRARRDGFDVKAVVTAAGREPGALLTWVREQTTWASYRGLLRGAQGVLLDRTGNSLDRATLLLALLEEAGHEARLARATLPADAAKALLADARQRDTAAPTTRPAESAAAAAARDDLARAATEAGVEPSPLLAEYDRRAAAAQAREAEARTRVKSQSDRLIAALKESGVALAAARDEATTADISAARDHWWVQYKSGAAWVDLDPSAPSDKPGAAIAPPEKTFAPERPGRPPAVPESEVHKVDVVVVVEQFDGTRLNERAVLRHTLRPHQRIGQVTLIGHHVTDGPGAMQGVADADDPLAALRGNALAQREWAPVLAPGDEPPVVQGGFRADGEVLSRVNLDPNARTGKTAGGKVSGATGLFDGLGASKPAAPADAPARQITAEWIDFTIRAPGVRAVTVRRQVFDLLGPAARTAGPGVDAIASAVGDERNRLNRALALAGTTEVLPLAGGLSAAFTDDLTAGALLACRKQLTQLASLTSTAGGSAKLEELLPAVADLRSMPGALHALAVARRGWGDGRTYQDRANVLAFRQYLRADGDKLVACEAFDIIYNATAARDGAGGAAAVLAQGVLDTNAEALLASHCAGATGAAAQYERAGEQGRAWHVAIKPDDDRLRDAQLPADARARMEQDLKAGYVVVYPPDARAAGDPEQRVAWWRIDPRTGQTLGINHLGQGASATEYVITLRLGIKVALLTACIVGFAHHRLLVVRAVALVGCVTAAGISTAAVFTNPLAAGSVTQDIIAALLLTMKNIE